MTQITVDRRYFARAVNLAQSVIQRKKSLPMLGMIRATANGALTLESTDLDQFARIDIPYQGEHCAMVIPDGRRVTMALHAAGGEYVELGQRDSRFHMKSGAFAAELTTLDPVDFPKMDEINVEEFSATFGSEHLAQIARIVPAISDEMTRYYLNGIAVEKIGDWSYRFKATDGHRLMMVDIPLPDARGQFPDDIIIPKRFVHLALTHFAKTKQPVRMAFGGHRLGNGAPDDLAPSLGHSAPRLSLSTETGEMRITLTTKLVDGNYPLVARVVPGARVSGLRIDRRALAQAVRAVSAIKSERTAAIRLTFGRESVEVALRSLDLGDAKIKVSASHNIELGTTVGFNSNYLLSMLGAFSGDVFEIAWDGPGSTAPQGSPCLITDPADTAFQAVLMPMRV